MSNQNYYSVLNTVAAASGDYATVAGQIKLTGLPAYYKVNSNFTKTAGSSFTTLDTNATVGTSGTVLTWTTNPTTSVTGEVLEVSKNGVTYLAYILTGGAGATVAVAWIGPNGTPADAAGYTVVRKGATFTKAVFSATGSATSYSLGVNFVSSATTEPLVYSNWTFDATASTTTANLQDSFYNWAVSKLSASGYYVAKSSTNTVIIYNPVNSVFKITAVNTTGYTAPTITQYATSTLAAAAIKGYGADLIAQYGYPVASSSTANDGVVSTNLYTVYEISVNNITAGGAINKQIYGLLINLGSANAATLISTLDSNL